MTLHKSTLAVIGAIILITIVIISAFMWQLMTSNLSELEEEDVSREVDGILFAFHEELSALNRIGGDWASWNETRDFVLDGNEEYVQANLDEVTLANLGVNFMLFFNRSGGLVYGKAIALDSKETVQVLPDLTDLPHDDLLTAHASPGDNLTGIMALPQGLMMVSSRPILDNQWNGPITGTLIVGRLLD
jgi:sensor domain CHASE-containing protein